MIPSYNLQGRTRDRYSGYYPHRRNAYYLERRPLPRSDRHPLQLVVNYGTLHLPEDRHRDRSDRVVYNAPSAHITVDGPSAGLYGGGTTSRARRASLLAEELDSGLYDVDSIGRGICRGCYKRRPLRETGYCYVCSPVSPRTRERMAVLDGVQYSYGRTYESDRRDGIDSRIRYTVESSSWPRPASAARISYSSREPRETRVRWEEPLYDPPPRRRGYRSSYGYYDDSDFL